MSGLNPNANSFMPSWGVDSDSRGSSQYPQQPQRQQRRAPAYELKKPMNRSGMYKGADDGYKQPVAYGQSAGRSDGGYKQQLAYSQSPGRYPQPNTFTHKEAAPTDRTFTHDDGIPLPSAFTHDDGVPLPSAFTHNAVPQYIHTNAKPDYDQESSPSHQSVSHDEDAEFLSDKSEKSPPLVSVKPAPPPPVETKTAKAESPAKPKKPSPSENSARSNESSKKKKTSKSYENLKPFDSREHINIVFMGHVDAGKSTMSGQILLQMGKIDERTIEKYEREAKEKNRESWWIAYIMDENEEERAKGKTVELGRAHFETAVKRYTILDAPGHKLYVPNMISGAQQADVGVLIISARKGEFEAGFARQGQTREHSILAHTLGITRVVVIVNKMDEPTVKWSQDRYNNIQNEIQDFLTHQVGFKQKNIKFLPVSAQTGANILKKVSPELCPWYKGESFIGTLDGLKKIKRLVDDGLRLPVDVFDVSGKKTCVGKVESGSVHIGQKIILMPEQIKTEVLLITIDEKEAEIAGCGEQVTLLIKQPASCSIVNGAYVICNVEDPCPRVRVFECLIEIKELMDHKPLMSVGYQAVIHVHNAAKPCEIVAIDNLADMKMGRFSKKPPPFLKAGQAAVCRVQVPTYIPLEASVPLGRFTLRDEGRTIAIGKVTSTDEKSFGMWVKKEAARGKERKTEKKSKKDKKRDKKARKNKG